MAQDTMVSRSSPHSWRGSEGHGTIHQNECHVVVRTRCAASLGPRVTRGELAHELIARRVLAVIVACAPGVADEVPCSPGIDEGDLNDDKFLVTVASEQRLGVATRRAGGARPSNDATRPGPCHEPRPTSTGSHRPVPACRRVVILLETR